MKPKKPELKIYKVARVETRAYVYDVEAENEDEAQEKLQYYGLGKRCKYEDFTVEVSYQVL